jgi:hypothetical protein
LRKHDDNLKQFQNITFGAKAQNEEEICSHKATKIRGLLGKLTLEWK